MGTFLLNQWVAFQPSQGRRNLFVAPIWTDHTRRMNAAAVLIMWCVYLWWMIEAAILSLSVLQPSPASVQQQQPLSDRGWAWSRASGGQPPLSWPLIGQLWPDPGLWLAQGGPWSLMLARLGRLVPLTHIVKARQPEPEQWARPGPAWRDWEQLTTAWLTSPACHSPAHTHLKTGISLSSKNI